MPPRVHDDALGCGLQTRAEVVDVPLPNAVTDSLAVGVFLGAKWIVDDAEIRTEARNARLDTCSEVFTA